MSRIRTICADGTIQSHEIHKVPNRAVALIKVVNIGGLVFGLSKHGTIYAVSGFYRTGSHSYVGWRHSWLPDVATCLYRLGVISAEDLAATLEKNNSATLSAHREYLALELINHACELGLKLTKSQQSKLGKITESGSGRAG